MPQSGAKAPRLLIDAMLGDLARRLRWLGYDAEYRNDLPDEEMIRIAREDQRLLVTRDRELAGRRGVRALYLAATDLDEQVRQVVEAVGPALHPSRCTVCNGELVSIPPEEAAALVPPYVAQTQTEFMRCKRCGRVYWPGSHWPGLQRWRDVLPGKDD
jgi:uncharacterized protein with PIN domain